MALTRRHLGFVLVSAGASGIGASIAERFRADGARVSICDRDEAAARLATQRDPALHAVVGDVADAAAMQAMADAVIKQLGRIDILVNNAALRREKPFAEMSYAEWREIMDVTLDGTFHCVKACLPAFFRLSFR